ncbi:alpha/beta hydrolase fold domain-containing protein [Rhizobacter sp. LjRoot28]|uniref:alpha/beta hydrolase fold domain-containing protein n=1 Tax=Rhizobacter sp. LjRoot28 TaxID=3342309 RepID=UPI003ED0A41C
MTDLALQTATSSAAGGHSTDHRVDLAGRAVTVRVYGDPHASLPQALVLHFHGGTFTNGSLDDGGSFARLLAAAGALVASVDYPLAPAHPFPEAVDTGFAALDWLRGLRGRRHGTATPVYVAGEEAGGNIAAAVALMVRDRSPGLLAGQMLMAPLLDPCMGSATSRAAGVGAGNCPVGCGWREYLSRPADISHPYAAPAVAVRLAGMPPALIVSFPGHPLREDAHRYAARLAETGVPAREVELATDPRRNGGTWEPAALDALRQFMQPAERNRRVKAQ